MNFLQGLIAESNVLLNITQKGILAACAVSQTPQLAFEATNGSEPLVVQRNQLQKLGLVELGQGTLSLTQTGRQALVTNNLTDETGELTADGKLFMDGVTVERSTANDVDQISTEGFAYLRSLLVEVKASDK